MYVSQGQRREAELCRVCPNLQLRIKRSPVQKTTVSLWSETENDDECGLHEDEYESEETDNNKHIQLY